MSIVLVAIGGAIFLLGGIYLIKNYLKRKIEKENRRLRAKIVRYSFDFNTEDKQGEYLEPEEDYSEEKSEEKGFPSSAVMDEEDEDED